MASYEILKRRLCQLGEDAAALIDEAGTLIGENDERFSEWEMTCRTLVEQIHDEVMRVAVVGAIKSGKSTLVNTLLGGDFLKRGAGVVTSIVTRVRAADNLGATLRFKGWDAINADIRQAAAGLPDCRSADAQKPLDLRNPEDRRMLQQALGELAADQLITQDTRTAGTVLLASCLQGYDRVSPYMKPDPGAVVFESAEFFRHRDFVGEDALAVYLSDVLLEIDSAGVGEGVEIADCQGSDSPNPFHMAMIQDYLALAHLILYVISSRTGVRQADIRFLSMIRRMGILDAVTVVVNDDLSEHESLAALQEGVRRVDSDLRLLFSNPRIFSFSALFRLMEQTSAALSPRDRKRLEHWREETEMVEFCVSEHQRFQAFLTHTLNQERNALLLKNHLERLEVVVAGIGNGVAFHRGLLAADTGDGHLADAAREQRGRLDRLKVTTQNTLDGAVNQVKTDIKRATDQFFDGYGDGVVAQLIRFIRNYSPDLPRQAERLASAGFTRTLYLVFQEFRQAVDVYMAETVNPQVIRFIRDQENAMATYLDEVAGPFGGIIDEAMARYANAIANATGSSGGLMEAPVIRIRSDLNLIRKTAGLSLPTTSVTMRYSVQVRSEAVMRLGLNKMTGFFRRLFRRQPAAGDAAHQDSMTALSSAVKRMKAETEQSVLFHLKDYRENIKFQYLMKLADAAGTTLQRQMLSRFQHYGTDLSRLMRQIAENRLDKRNVITRADEINAAADALKTRIQDARTELLKMAE